MESVKIMNLSFKGLINNKYCGVINTDSIRRIRPCLGILSQYTDIEFNNGDKFTVDAKYRDVIDSISHDEAVRYNLIARANNNEGYIDYMF